jgi:cobalt-zinc-cadmium efflux system protein
MKQPRASARMAAAHAHDHTAPADLGPAFKWAVGLNVGYIVVEVVAGLAVGSLALLADAAHNVTDVAGLLIAWGAAVAARQPPSQRFTYGFGRSTILAALANAIALLLGVGAVLWESIQRLGEPVAVAALPVLLVAGLGVVVNGGTALLFTRARHSDLNAEGAFLHMAADAAVSLGVVLAAGGMLLTGWYWLDPLAAIVVSLVIAWSTWRLLKSALALSLDAVPAGIDRAAVEARLRALTGVSSVHDLHIWSLSTTRTALTAHLVMPGGCPGDAFLEAVAEALEDDFGIGHVTLQVECGDGDSCRLAPADRI